MLLLGIIYTMVDNKQSDLRLGIRIVRVGRLLLTTLFIVIKMSEAV